MYAAFTPHFGDNSINLRAFVDELVDVRSYWVHIYEISILKSSIKITNLPCYCFLLLLL